ncbi:hypothetical protein ARMGADRAFT_1022990 [Armillaria gallica]|uniref:Uncharacterized protein n=1 Tax=Armillaria gallica TaxID=47427 RepID=A0A2H3EZC2_ARMGA|nr:hypothetical protein ARMGADRAFT_1022990 [Armillaria gallica]
MTMKESSGAEQRGYLLVDRLNDDPSADVALVSSQSDVAGTQDTDSPSPPASSPLGPTPAPDDQWETNNCLHRADAKPKTSANGIPPTLSIESSSCAAHRGHQAKDRWLEAASDKLMPPIYGHEGHIDRKPIPAPPTHQHGAPNVSGFSQMLQHPRHNKPFKSHGAELRSRRFREGGRVRASKVKDDSSIQRNSEE